MTHQFDIENSTTLRIRDFKSGQKQLPVQFNPDKNENIIHILNNFWRVITCKRVRNVFELILVVFLPKKLLFEIIR